MPGAQRHGADRTARADKRTTTPARSAREASTAGPLPTRGPAVTYRPTGGPDRERSSAFLTARDSFPADTEAITKVLSFRDSSGRAQTVQGQLDEPEAGRPIAAGSERRGASDGE